VEHSQNAGAELGYRLAPHFGNVPPPMAITFLKAKFIMNQTYVDHKEYEWVGSYAYFLIVGGFLPLQVGIISLPSLKSRHNNPANF
jgi:hypothetical protein